MILSLCMWCCVNVCECVCASDSVCVCVCAYMCVVCVFVCVCPWFADVFVPMKLIDFHIKDQLSSLYC